ncbi:hypothetical protein L873DRAFT_946966 [Choiromyces venosus 120613-1]|uniref:Uncharacterized protein n=1 Tax=Choiromyces venosus 120613-1 TaxID=1336337 RepID=A0A3N4K3H3_9PEZI|nr:hypothetical protein L873DRAFT_946966 [Choiromyces venosus 120613-1]
MINNEHQTRPSGKGKAPKWLSWMDQALVWQVLITDPLNCMRGSTATKWAEVSLTLDEFQPQPISCSSESCRQRVKKLVEIYKKVELDSLYKSGIDEEFTEFKLNIVELTIQWDQSSNDPGI